MSDKTNKFGKHIIGYEWIVDTCIQLSYDDVGALLKPSLDYIGAVRRDPDVLRYHIGYPFRAEEMEGELNPLKSKNDRSFLIA